MRKILFLISFFVLYGLISKEAAFAQPDALEELISGTTSQNSGFLSDPELSETPLPKLVLPPAEPPSHIRLPELIVKSNEWKGVQCGVSEPRFAVFRHADKWQSFWEKAMAPYSARLSRTPAIDFQKDMVIGVFLGQMPYPSYEIEIRAIREESRPEGKTLVVRYREVKKMRGVFVPPFAVQPFHLKRIPITEDPVVFLKVRR